MRELVCTLVLLVPVSALPPSAILLLRDIICGIAEGCQPLGNKGCTRWSACLRESWCCVLAHAAGDRPRVSDAARTLWIYCTSLWKGLAVRRLDIAEAEYF